jgi:hypothetical protein
MRRYSNLASASSYFQQPDEAAWNITPTTPPSFVTSPVDVSDILADEQPTPKAKGRHVFTKEECSRGFWAAVESIITRYPDAIMSDGRHMVCNFLRSRSQEGRTA